MARPHRFDWCSTAGRALVVTAIVAGAAGCSAAASPAPVTRHLIYTVRSGDKAAAVAARFGIATEKLFDANPSVPRDETRPLPAGLMLVVPDPAIMPTPVPSSSPS